MSYVFTSGGLKYDFRFYSRRSVIRIRLPRTEVRMRVWRARPALRPRPDPRYRPRRRRRRRRSTMCTDPSGSSTKNMFSYSARQGNQYTAGNPMYYCCFKYDLAFTMFEISCRDQSVRNPHFDVLDRFYYCCQWKNCLIDFKICQTGGFLVSQCLMDWLYFEHGIT